MPQECTQIVRAFYEAFSSGDAAGFAALLHPAVQWFAAENLLYADRSPYVGPDAVQGLIFGRLLADWENLAVTASEILGRGDLVIASGRFRGTYKGNGASIDAQLVQVFQFEDGKISKVQVYTDTAQFKESISQMRSAAT
jgi:ketosteroid isomerase-like protein